MPNIRPASDLAATANYPEVSAVTVANAGTTTAEINLDGTHLVGIECPTALTSTALTFQVAQKTGGIFQDLYDQFGTKVSIPVAASRTIYLDPNIFAGFQFIKLVCGSAEAAARTFFLFKRVI